MTDPVEPEEERNADREPGGDDRVPVFGGGGSGASTRRTTGEARRTGVPEWVAVVAGVTVVLGAWLGLTRGSDGDESIGGPVAVIDDGSADDDQGPEREPLVQAEPPGSTAAPGTTAGSEPTTTAGPAAVPAGDTSGPQPAPAVMRGALTDEGWRLIVGDGHSIEMIDLDDNARQRFRGVGAPLALVDGRLLLYENSELSWGSIADLGGEVEPIASVPTLQQMFTRARSVDRPLVVDDGEAVWWPNNNATPQTWVKLRLADGTVLDSIALTDTVFGGPDVVATMGSGTFERVDGRWAQAGDLFASSASSDLIVGQRCTEPEQCAWVALDRGTGAVSTLPYPVGGPFDVLVLPDAGRPLIVFGRTVTDLDTGRTVALDGLNPQTMTAVNAEAVLALADGGAIGAERTTITLHELDGPDQGQPVEVELVELVPRWMVLVPPGAAR